MYFYKKVKIDFFQILWFWLGEIHLSSNLVFKELKTTKQLQYYYSSTLFYNIFECVLIGAELWNTNLMVIITWVHVPFPYQLCKEKSAR